MPPRAIASSVAAGHPQRLGVTGPRSAAEQELAHHRRWELGCSAEAGVALVERRRQRPHGLMAQLVEIQRPR